MQNDQEKQSEQLEQPEVFEPSSQERYGQREETSIEEQEQQVEQEPTQEDREAVREQLERKAEEMEVTPEIKEDIRTHVSSAKVSGDDEATLQRLMQIVQTKGVRFALKVAKEMDNSYVVDLLHDALAADNLYKRSLD